MTYELYSSVGLYETWKIQGNYKLRAISTVLTALLDKKGHPLTARVYILYIVQWVILNRGVTEFHPFRL